MIHTKRERKRKVISLHLITQSAKKLNVAWRPTVAQKKKNIHPYFFLNSTPNTGGIRMVHVQKKKT